MLSVQPLLHYLCFTCRNMKQDTYGEHSGLVVEFGDLNPSRAVLCH